MPRAIFLLLILAAHSIVASSRAEGKVSSDRPSAPQFTLKDARGRFVRLKDYSGKIVVINFWATWRPPCLAEIPEFVRLQRNYRDQGVQIIGVTYPPLNRSRVKRLAARFRINYPLPIGTRRIAALYEVTNVLPVTVIVGRQGKLESRIDGVTDLQEIKKFLQ